MASNKIRYLSDEICQLQKLIDFDLGDNELTCINSKLFTIHSLKTLAVQGNQLRNVPHLMEDGVCLRKLDLSNNNFDFIPVEILELKSLRHLNMSDNQIMRIDWNERMTNLTSVLEMNLKGNDLNYFSPLILQPLRDTLKILNLNENKLDCLPQQIGDLYYLEELYAENNLIKEIPDEIAFCTKLRIINLNQNKIDSLPVEMKRLNNLHILELANNNISLFSNTLATLTSLKKLILSHNEIEDLPLEMSNSTGMEYLDLSFNKFKTLPYCAYSMIKLKVLNLQNNQLSLLHGEVGNLFELEEIRLDENILEILPKEMCKLSLLRHLSVSNNRLGKLPKEKYLRKLEVLEYLNVSGNYFESFPIQIKSLINLKSLIYNQYDRNQKLEELPEELSQLSNLENAEFKYNAIWQIDAEPLSHLPKIKSIHLNNNKIERITDEFCKAENIQNIQVLSLNGNLLTNLPLNFDLLANLKHLDLEDNPVRLPPSTVCTAGNVRTIGSFIRRAISRNDALLLRAFELLKDKMNKHELRYLAHKFRLPEVEVTAIEKKHNAKQELHQRVLAILHLWRQENGEEANVERLIHILYIIGLEEAAELIRANLIYTQIVKF
ncbi:DgyrCDS7441 [Dimorphilus gyrociliatus]|nr:DgyrCDS7441 [Dimorphilus gyrociliatus]